MSEGADLPADVFQVTPRAITTILARAAERGEIRPDRVTARIARLPGDLLRCEMMLHPADAPGTVLAEILDEIFSP